MFDEKIWKTYLFNEYKMYYLIWYEYSAQDELHRFYERSNTKMGKLNLMNNHCNYTYIKQFFFF